MFKNVVSKSHKNTTWGIHLAYIDLPFFANKVLHGVHWLISPMTTLALKANAFQIEWAHIPHQS